MRILVISDIHGNWPALAAIDEPHDLCLCLGDLVDYGPDPARCVRWAMDHTDYAIRGNHDHGVAQGVPVQGESGYRYLTRVSRQWVWDALGPEERLYLLQLPVTQRLTLDGKRFLLVHATPRDPLDEYLMKDPETWARRVHNVDADIVCVGHSHMQFIITVDGVSIVNPGSVGQPRDGDPRAAYAVIEGGKIELKRVAYPIDETVARIAESPLPEKAKGILSQCLRLGRLPPIPRKAGSTESDGPELGDEKSDPDLE
jgi:putative phosphoesterase